LQQYKILYRELNEIQQAELLCDYLTVKYPKQTISEISKAFKSIQAKMNSSKRFIILEKLRLNPDWCGNCQETWMSHYLNEIEAYPDYSMHSVEESILKIMSFHQLRLKANQKETIFLSRRRALEKQLLLELGIKVESVKNTICSDFLTLDTMASIEQVVAHVIISSEDVENVQKLKKLVYVDGMEWIQAAYLVKSKCP
jgi:predicted amino acid-binding ACT domain protein